MFKSWVALFFFSCACSYGAIAATQITPQSFAAFVEFIQRQPQVSPQFKRVVAMPAFSRKIIHSENFRRFVDNMGERRQIESYDPHPTYKQEVPIWSAESRALLDTDLYFVRYANRLELVMERIALVDSCQNALQFGTRPAEASPAARDYLIALLYRSWTESKETGLPVQIVAKRLNSNPSLNAALEHVGFELQYPNKEYFSTTSTGKIDWPKSLKEIAEKNLNITLQLNLHAPTPMLLGWQGF